MLGEAYHPRPWAYRGRALAGGHHPVTRFLAYTFAWAVTLAVVLVLFNLAVSPIVTLDRPSVLLALAVSGLGMFLPFAAFAGGLTLGTTQPGASRPAFAGGMVIASVSFTLLAYVGPLADYRDEQLLGLDVEARHPFGPNTASGLLRHLSYARANPSPTPSLAVERALDRPAYWIEHLLHERFSIPLFAVVSALLGQLIAVLTSGLSPPRRRHLRWALGIASGLVYFTPAAILDSYAVQAVVTPGIVTAWVPHILPISILATLWLMVRRAPVGSGHG